MARRGYLANIMGCDITTWAEKQLPDGTWQLVGSKDEFFTWRQYGMYEFFTGGTVRGYSEVPQVLPTPRGFPKDSSVPNHFITDCEEYGHNLGYLTVEELNAVDYTIEFVDRREQDEPTHTLGKFLGDHYFLELGRFVASGATRLLFAFDS